MNKHHRPARRSSLEHRRKALKRARRKSTKRKAADVADASAAQTKPRTGRKAVRTSAPAQPVASTPTPATPSDEKQVSRKDRREAKTVVRKAVRRAVRKTQPAASKPAQSTASKPAQPPTSKPAQPASDPMRTIYIGIEANASARFLAIKWPSLLKNLTVQFTYDPDAPGSLSELCKVMGRIIDLKGNQTKKLAPLNYSTAVEALKVLKRFRKQMRAVGSKYDIQMSDDFIAWYNEEDAAKDVCRAAHKLLDYDADTIQTEYPFLKHPLYPWQSAAMQFLNVVTRDGRGAFLCDDTGLGKTWELVAHLAWLKHTNASGGGKAVIVCPAALRLPWQRKIRQATKGGLTTKIIEGGYCADAHKYDVLIVGYRTLMKIKGKLSRQKRDGSMTRQVTPSLWYLKGLIEKQQRVLVMDEGHFAKEYSSERATMCLYLAEYAKHSVVLTATPLKNRVAELHPLLRITRRLWTGASLKVFKKMYSTPEAQEDIAEHLTGEGGFMVRRLTPEVWVDAPKGEVARAPCDLTNWDHYRAVENNFIDWLQRQGADEDKIMRAERGYVLTQLNMLRQLAATGKIRDTIKLINETLNRDEQVVVFSDFKDTLSALYDRFKNKMGTNHLGQQWVGAGKIVGGQTDKARMKMIDQFQAGKLGLMCVSIRAGGFGIDLPASCYGYFMDLPWSPADFEQCTGRLLRLGQTRDCQFIKLLAQGTVDERIEALIYSKAQIFQRAIGDDGIVQRVTGSDVEALQDSLAKQIVGSYIRGLAA